MSATADDNEKMKRILKELDKTDTQLETFYTQLEKEFGNKIRFSKLKTNLENFYITIIKTDLFFLLSKAKLDDDGFINLANLFNNFSEISGIKFTSPKLTFYLIANRLQKLKISTLEFIYQNNLTLNSELTINEFITSLTSKLELENEKALGIFNALDINNQKKVKVDDFVVVVDSYREGYDAVPASTDPAASAGTFDVGDKGVYWINKFLGTLKDIGITEVMMFNAAKNGEESEIDIDNMKKKMLLMLPKGKLTAIELNNIADAFDVHKNRKINFEDYCEVIKSATNDPKYTSLMKCNENTFPLISLFNTSDASKLPFRTNNNFKYKATSKTPQREGDFVVDDNFNAGTNLNAEAFESNVKMNQYTLGSKALKPSSPETVMKELVKELQVFESGEWSLIEALEEFDIPENSEYAATFDLFKVLEDKFTPTITKDKISKLTSYIDFNNDGFISYIDMINFLNDRMNYKSSCIGWKQVAYKILNIYNASIDDYLSKNLQCDKKDEVNFISFAKLMINNFEIPAPVAKKMFDDLASMINRNITRGDVIDCVGRVLEKRRNRLRATAKTIDLDSTSIKEIENTSSVVNVNVIDKKYYEQEMKKFVSMLQKGFVPSKDPEVKDTLQQNLKIFLDLPEKMKLSKFREKFIKPLGMDYALGIATFNIAKEMENSDQLILSEISLSTLMNIITSYIDYNIIDFNPAIFIFFLGSASYPSIQLVFETIEYNYTGVAILDIIKEMEMFYPKVPKSLLKGAVMKIDTDQTGLVTYKTLSDFVFAKSHTVSTNLMLKHLASILDIKGLNTEEYFKRMLTNNPTKKAKEIMVNFDDHNNYFSTVLKFTIDQSEGLFLYLSNIRNKNSYSLNRIVIEVNQIRTQPQTSTDVVSFADKKARSHVVAEALNILNSNIPLCTVFSKLKLDSSLVVSIAELNQLITREYKDVIPVQKSDLMTIFKHLDSKNRGFVSYVSFHKFLRNHLQSNFTGCTHMHMQYIAYKMFKEFSGKWKDYTNYKQLKSTEPLSIESFLTKFKVDECLNDAGLCYSIFDFIKNDNVVYVQDYIDYLRGIIDKEYYEDESEEDEIKLEKSEIKGIVNDVFNGDYDLTAVFESVNMNQVNSFGKVNWNHMKRVLSENASFDSRQLAAFKGYFCTVPMLFDMFKLTNLCLKYKTTINESTVKNKIIKAIKTSNEKDFKTMREFFKLFNLETDRGNNVSEFVLNCKKIFEITQYESFVIFTSFLSDEERENKETFRVSMNDLISKYGLLPYFKEEVIVKKEVQDPLLPIALERFGKHCSKKGVITLFKEYDRDNNGVLDRDEFFSLIDNAKIEGVNSSMKVLILDYLDRNKDGVISLDEIKSFAVDYESEVNPVEEEEQSEEKPEEPVQPPVVQYTSIIDYAKLEDNYKFNQTQLGSSTLTSLDKNLIKIQAYLVDNKPLSNAELSLHDEADEEGKVPADRFKFIFINELQYAFPDEEIKLLFSYAKKKKGMIDYKNFLNQVTSYSYAPVNLKEENEEDIVFTKAHIKAKLNRKFKNRNKQFAFYLKQHFGREFNFNNVNEVTALKSALMKTFAFAEKQINNVQGISPQNLYTFKKFMTVLSELDENIEYSYNLTDDDVYVRPYSPNEKVCTILTSEEAAIKKCDLLYHEAMSSKTNFVDPDFGEVNTKKSLYSNAIPTGAFEPSDISWYTIEEISPNTPSFLSGRELSSQDVIQGSLGDRWFVSGLAILSNRDHLLRGEFSEAILNDGKMSDEELAMISTGIYPPIFHQFRNKGIYCFRFYKNFQYYYVIVDDRLPCLKVDDTTRTKPRLIYSKSRNENDFWVSLIEKAYAKLHGSYEKLISGFIEDALNDLTGLNVRRYLMDDIAESETRRDRLWTELVDHTSDFHIAQMAAMKKFNFMKTMTNIILNKNNTLIACDIDAKGAQEDVIYNGEKCGLLSGHSYSMLRAFEVPKPFSQKMRKCSRLLLLRNPWGVKEWNGKWSDNSEEIMKKGEQVLKAMKLPKELAKKNNPSDPRDTNDGRFIISFSDFRKIFSKLYIAYQMPLRFVNFYYDDSFSEQSGGIPIKNTKEDCDDWSKNPQYYIKTTKDSTRILVELLQKDGRMNEDRFPFVHSLDETIIIILRVTEKKALITFDAANVVGMSKVRLHRKNSLPWTLEKGEYIISLCSRKKNSTNEFRCVFHVEDVFKSDNFTEENFMDSLKTTYVEKLNGGNKPKAHLMVSKPDSAEYIEKKKNMIYLQMKRELKHLYGDQDLVKQLE